MNSILTLPCRTPLLRIRQAFTLVELLLSVSILSLLVLMLSNTLKDVQNVVTRSQTQVAEFEDARHAFESMTRRISQATLNAYWGYVFENSNSNNPNPKYFSRLSDLHFVIDQIKVLLPNSTGNGHGIFFQAMLGDTDPNTAWGESIKGMNELLNCWGYYIDYGSDEKYRPTFLNQGHALDINPQRKRFRLMEFRQPPDESILFSPSLNLNQQTNRSAMYQWFRGPFKNGLGTTADYSIPVADNIIALIISPYTYVTSTNASGSSTTDMRKKSSYEYDTRKHQWSTSTGLDVLSSKHRPPAMVEITLIATDERSYDQLEQRLGEEGAADAIRNVFAGLLTNPTKLSLDVNKNVNQDTGQEFEIDIIQERLDDLGMHYKIFSTTFPIASSKWITEKETF